MAFSADTDASGNPTGPTTTPPPTAAQPGQPPTTNPSTPTSSYGSSALDTIGNIFKAATGRAPTQAEVSQWGTNIDPNYMATIQSAIYNTDEAKAYAAKQAAPAAPAAATTPTAPAATGSPVTATGQIAPATPAAPAPTPAPQPTPSAARVVTPVSLANVPAYSPTALTNTYNPTPVSQFSAPDQSGTNAQQNALMSAILANPETMNPNVVAQMKEAQKEQALSMAGQTQQGLDASSTANGTLGSGAAAANAAANRQSAINSILTGNRNTDIAAASTNRQDQLNAEAASSALAQDQLGRATSGYATTLAGQTAADQQQQFKSTGDLNAAQLNNTNSLASGQDAVSRLLSQFGINQGVAANAQTNYGADLTAALQKWQQQMDAANFGENQRQFNDTLGYNYNALDQSGNQTVDQILQSLGL